MGIAILLAGFLAAFVLGRRSIGWGVSAVLTVGYAYGMLRAHLLDPATYFAFDAAVLGLYAGFLRNPDLEGLSRRGRAALVFTILLCAWPALLILLPDSALLVRMVGLRAAVLLLPMVAIGARASTRDLRRVGVSLLVLNAVAITFGCLEYLYGLEPFIPRVASTELIYRSNDIRVGDETFHRIPSIFVNAHAFGGTMVASLPLLLAAFVAWRPGPRVGRVALGVALVVATLVGVFLCGARQPVVILILIVGLTALRGGIRRQSVWLVLLAGLAVGLVVSEVVRLQRAMNLLDPEVAISRVSQSVNESFFDLLSEHPFGRGLGSAVGTSMPSFLKDDMPVQIGLESEYSRLLVEQGVVGLLFWIAFILWLVAKPVHPPTPAWRLSFVAMQALAVATWVAALIGTGTLTSIPQSALALFQMGVVAGLRWPAPFASRGPGPPARAPIAARPPPPGWMPVPRADRPTGEPSP